MLEKLGSWVALHVFRLNEGSRLAEAVSFFVEDTIKITALLLVLIFLIGVVRSFIPHEKIRRWMSKTGLAGHFFAALFGAVTPFCSCSSIPIFFAFLKAGVPLGVMFSFLITSPVVNEYVVVLMFGAFGWKIAVAYVLSGMLIGIVSGILLGRMKLEKHLVEDFVFNSDNAPSLPVFSTFMSRISFGWREAISITRKIWGWILVGVGVGAIIHNYVPRETIDGLISATGVFSVPVATLLGVPLYGSCAAVVPIAVELFQKGMPLGTALSFLMAISALSLPEAVMLRRAMKLPLIMMFFCVTALAIMITGYIFNFLQVVLV